ncbi:MAG: HAD hydrolase family protein [Thermodesulfovibrionales bacterium]|nr:HAD hydrolase family protein [Thermodesulfovibrionales bacterium]
MFELDIPGFGILRLEHLVSDFTGTLSVDGRLIPGVKERLNELSEHLKIHILTADTFGRAKEELKDINCEVHILKGEDHDIQKEEYVKKLGPERVIAFGNGNNDTRMLKTARLGVAVIIDEGCSGDAMRSADIIVKSITDGLDLLLNPKRLKATLRF